jgi:hypothetical protein
MSQKTITLVDIYNRETSRYDKNRQFSAQEQRSRQEVLLDKEAFVKAINKHSNFLKDISTI